MPRGPRVAPGGFAYHVINRGNGRRTLFRKEEDYAAFVELLGEARERLPGVGLLGYCLMPNHFHLALYPRKDGELSGFMRWLTNTHVRRYHQHYRSYGQGHVYQGRFKGFLIQEDRHLLTVLRYIESNPLRCRRPLVERAELWPWSSLGTFRGGLASGLLSEWPVERPRNWVRLVNQAMDEAVVKRVRVSVERQRPYGEDRWVKHVAEKLGLEWTLRPRGRPRVEKT